MSGWGTVQVEVFGPKQAYTRPVPASNRLQTHANIPQQVSCCLCVAGCVMWCCAVLWCVAISSEFEDLVRVFTNDTDCVYTEPTPITQEQPQVNGELPKLRLDYILGNKAALSVGGGTLKCSVVDDDDVVGYLSDHYPVECHWRVSPSPMIRRWLIDWWYWNETSLDSYISIVSGEHHNPINVTASINSLRWLWLFVLQWIAEHTVEVIVHEPSLGIKTFLHSHELCPVRVHLQRTSAS